MKLTDIKNSLNEAKEPDVITQLRKIVKNKQNDLIKDTKSGKKVRVDMNSANLMVQVYDALKQQSNKDKFVKGGVVSMAHMAHKLMKKESVNEAYVVLHSPKKGVKPVATAAYADKKDAEKWAKDLGGITMIVKKKMKGIDESVNEGKFDGIGDLVKSLHFEINPKTAEEKKIELGKRQGEVSKRKQKESGEYSLRLFRKKIKYGNGKDVGVFLPGSYDAVTSKLGDGPHKKAVKKVRWTQKKYDQWLEDMASNGGARNAFDMAQNAKNEPGLIDWVKKNFRGDKPLQRIQWDIEGFNESVNEVKYYITRNQGRGRGKSLVGGYDLKKDKKLPPKEFRTFKDAEKEVKRLKNTQKGIPGGGSAYIITDKNMKPLKESTNETMNEGKKRFYQQDRVGSAKYTISYHDGKSKHKDGSDFYGIQILKNKKELEKFRSELLKKGYREDSGFKKESVNEGYGEFIKAKNLTDIIKLSKQKKNAVFYVTDDNNSRIGTFYLKNGKFAKATSANPNYDLQNSKTKLKDRSDVIYKYKIDESVVNEMAMGFDTMTGLFYLKGVPFTKERIKEVILFMKSSKPKTASNQLEMTSALIIKDKVNKGEVTIDSKNLKILIEAFKKYKNLASDKDF